ncbi:MAG TPA: fumarylacetoacetate hydrolase family protein [Burkholderiaceae bacterium]|nr:fumarylacetoacetate hydrolase family protein [Burkholderiaceae bacterium]
MKLATLRDTSRDGKLIIVNRPLTRWVSAATVAPTMQAALDAWSDAEQPLRKLYDALNDGTVESQPLDFEQLAAPLPRAYAWMDGSAFLNHMELARRLRGAKMPEGFRELPLMYEGISSTFHACRDSLPLPADDVGLDIEGEIGVILDDVPQGVSAQDASAHIKLVTLVNDTSLRSIIADRAARGYPTSVHGKPPCAMAPVAVTPDEFGDAWDGSKLSLRLRSKVNDDLLGEPNAGVDMFFDFPALVAHAAKYRPLCAGTIVGSGTVSNYDASAGSACIAERRMMETVTNGKPDTPYLKAGDVISIEMLDGDGRSVFGAIRQQVALAG